MSDPCPSHDVIIAGAGPVGLMLAAELALAGASVLILERDPDPDAPHKRLPVGLRGLSVVSLQTFDRRGLLGAIRAAAAPVTARPAHWRDQRRVPAGHFAGIQFFTDLVDPAQWPWIGAEETPGTLAVDIAGIERVLADHATSLGVEIRRGCGVATVGGHDDGVIVGTDDGTRRAARWLVGCDGGRSAVRKAVDIGFAGTAPEFTGYSIIATLADPDRIAPGRHHGPSGMYSFTPPGLFAIADYDGGAFHRTAPVTVDHVRALLHRVAGVAVDIVSVEVATTWTDRACQASAYRAGRVLLAGDAAHIHSPLGGQGLNLGLGDAMNLGWKLGAAIRGDAPAGLLDSYQAERQPVGARVLEWSRAQVALMRPTPGDRALEGVVRDLLATRDGATYAAGRVWGVDQRYDLGDASLPVGRSAPDLCLADGRRLNARLWTGGGVLLDASADGALRGVAARYAGLSHAAIDGWGSPGVAAMLVRPDGIVAWVSEAPVDADAASRAASRWFAAPGCAVATSG